MCATVVTARMAWRMEKTYTDVSIYSHCCGVTGDSRNFEISEAQQEKDMALF